MRIRTATWQQHLRQHGYAQFPSLIPARTVARLNDLIRADLAANYDSARQIEYDNQSFCPSLRESPEVLGLFDNSRIRGLADSAFGPKQYQRTKGQIAIRQAHNTDRDYPPLPHIDGIPTPVNGVTGGALHNFTALVGVFLTPVTHAFAGNFTVWPGSHLRLAEHFREEGPAALVAGMPQIPLGDPVQLHASPGDVVLSHYLLAHAAAVNTSANDRIAIFFRITVTALAGATDPGTRWTHLTDPWLGWRA